MNSVYYPHLTPEEKRQLDMGGAYQRAVESFWNQNFVAGVNTMILAVVKNVENYASISEFEDIDDVMSREDWQSPAEDAGACVVKTTDNDYFHFSYAYLNTIEVDGPGKAMINFEALAKHLGLDIDGHIFDDESTKAKALPAAEHSPGAYLASLIESTASDGQDVLEGLAYLAEYQHNDQAQQAIAGALANKDKAEKLLSNFVNHEYTGAADTFDSEDDAYRDFCDSNGLDPNIDEVLEHRAVSDWLFEELSSRGEATAEVAGFQVWGRMTTGQNPTMDSVISEIFIDKCGYSLDDAIKLDLPEAAARIDEQLAAAKQAEKANDSNSPSPI